MGWSRREFVGSGVGAAVAAALPGMGQAAAAKSPVSSGMRPVPAERRFQSEAVEAYIRATKAKIGDPLLARLFENCYPNTLDTTVVPGTFEGKPDTAVVTGDIAAMWLRDSSAQVWPYLPLAAKDERLRALLEGVIRRQARCILTDPYANAFSEDLSKPAPVGDRTEMRTGVFERKYELDSLCYPMRLAHGYWRATGDTRPFDARWARAMKLAVATMRVQQRKDGLGPYRFQRSATTVTETLGGDGYGQPVNPVGLIVSCFRPSDDACVLPFLVPSNLFAVVSLRQLAAMADGVLHDAALVSEATALAAEVEAALRQYAVVNVQGVGTVWAYEVDGFGGQVVMDDANVPSLLGLPYLGASPDAALYARTRQLVWSTRNPWFFRGSAGEGIGGPHEGAGYIWPMSQMVYALTSTSDVEIRAMLQLLKAGSAGSGFMHESYWKDDAKRRTRDWFAWANTLFGELVGNLAHAKPSLVS